MFRRSHRCISFARSITDPQYPQVIQLHLRQAIIDTSDDALPNASRRWWLNFKFPRDREGSALMKGHYTDASFGATAEGSPPPSRRLPRETAEADSRLGSPSDSTDLVGAGEDRGFFRRRRRKCPLPHPVSVGRPEIPAGISPLGIKPLFWLWNSCQARAARSVFVGSRCVNIRTKSERSLRSRKTKNPGAGARVETTCPSAGRQDLRRRASSRDGRGGRSCGRPCCDAPRPWRRRAAARAGPP